MKACRHRPTGFVTNQDPHNAIDFDRAHMSQTVCSRPTCVEWAQGKVAGFTNETATYYPFGAYRKPVTA